jgi:Acyltransferase family
MNLESTSFLTPAPAGPPAVATFVPSSAAVETATLVQADDNVAVGYLRAVVTVLVLAHHAVLAYNPYGPAAPPTSLNGPNQWWRAFPVIDSQRWAGFSLFNSFNDMFFMALMFLLSGLFVQSSLRRKGSGTFLRDRALRLGVPFVVAAGLVAPLAYYPAYLQSGGGQGFAGFWRQWRGLDSWPAGPAWFLWVLLAFAAVAAGLYRWSPRWGEGIGRLASRAKERPLAFFALLVGVSAAVYVPMELVFNGMSWAALGPFTFQTSRLLFYFVYFLAGVGVGAFGLQRGLLAPDGRLARRWLGWLVAALVVFALALTVIVVAMTAGAGARGWEIGGDLAFVVCCAMSGFGFLALFTRFARNRNRVFDSLRDNVYGMYIVHYAIVGWLQLALLTAPLPALAKGTLAFLGTLALSWAATAALRRIPGVARVL